MNNYQKLDEKNSAIDVKVLMQFKIVDNYYMLCFIIYESLIIIINDRNLSKIFILFLTNWKNPEDNEQIPVHVLHKQ